MPRRHELPFKPPPRPLPTEGRISFSLGIIFRASPDSVDSWENKRAGMESDKRRRQHLIPQFPFYRMGGRRSDGGEATGRGGETARQRPHTGRRLARRALG